jgi:AraC-like DNA-binding protein
MQELYSYKDKDLMFHYSMDPQPNPKDFAMHTHDQCEIYLFLAGKATFWVEGNAYPLSPGDLLIMRPLEAHCVAVEPDYPYQRAALHFDPKLISSEIDPENLLLAAFYKREAGKENCFHPADFPDEHHQQVLSQIMTKEPVIRTNILCHLFPLLYALHQAFERRIYAPNAEDSLSYRIIRYINQQITKPLSLDEICHQFFISKSQLCRLFKKSVGSTVWHYITVKRLMLARQQLSEGQPPSVVYSQCGFSDYSVFWRAYQKQFGYSPKQTLPKS